MLLGGVGDLGVGHLLGRAHSHRKELALRALYGLHGGEGKCLSVAELVVRSGVESRDSLGAVELLKRRFARRSLEVGAAVEVSRLCGVLIPIVADGGLVGVHIVHRKHHAVAPLIDGGVVGGEVESVSGSAGRRSDVYGVDVAVSVDVYVDLELAGRALGRSGSVGVLVLGRYEEGIDRTLALGRDLLKRALGDNVGRAVHLKGQNGLLGHGLGREGLLLRPGQYGVVYLRGQESEVREIWAVVAGLEAAAAVNSVRAARVFVKVAVFAEQVGGAPGYGGAAYRYLAEEQAVNGDHIGICIAVPHVLRLLRGISDVVIAADLGEFSVRKSLSLGERHLGDGPLRPVPQGQVQRGLSALNVQEGLAGRELIVFDLGGKALRGLIRGIGRIGRSVVAGLGASEEHGLAVKGCRRHKYVIISRVVVHDGGNAEPGAAGIGVDSAVAVLRRRFGEAPGGRFNYGIIGGVLDPVLHPCVVAVEALVIGVPLVVDRLRGVVRRLVGQILAVCGLSGFVRRFCLGVA